MRHFWMAKWVLESLFGIYVVNYTCYGKSFSFDESINLAKVVAMLNGALEANIFPPLVKTNSKIF